MEYFLTPNATAYKHEIDEAVAIVDHQIQSGFIPWLIPKFHRYDELYRKLDLPILFVTEDDFGKYVDVRDWYVVIHRTIIEPTSIR